MGPDFPVGLGLVGYSLQKYGVVNFRKLLGSRSDTSASEPVDTSKPLPVPRDQRCKLRYSCASA